MYCIYCITREDNQKYIGKAKNIKRRMSQHKKTKRFLNKIFIYEVLFYSESHELIVDAEKTYITIFDTYNNGLNLTPDGSGNNYTNKFTTFGLKWSDETKRKISINHYSKKEGYIPSMLGKTHSEEQKQHWSKIRKGKVHSTKYNTDDIKKLLLLYKTEPFLENANKIQKNGKMLSYDKAFCNTYAEKFNMCAPNMYKIITGKTIAWNPLYEEILNSKY